MYTIPLTRLQLLSYTFLFTFFIQIATRVIIDKYIFILILSKIIL